MRLSASWRAVAQRAITAGAVKVESSSGQSHLEYARLSMLAPAPGSQLMGNACLDATLPQDRWSASRAFGNQRRIQVVVSGRRQRGGSLPKGDQHRRDDMADADDLLRI